MNAKFVQMEKISRGIQALLWNITSQFENETRAIDVSK